jgi:hypothetical protein
VTGAGRGFQAPSRRSRSTSSGEHRLPGVHVEEVQAQPPAISAVASDLTAFVGFTVAGPLDTPVEVASFPDYEREFGPLHGRSTVGFAVQAFFENGGRRAVVVRAGGVAERRTAARLVPRERNGRGLFALESFGYVGLVCLPPVGFSGHLRPALVARAAAFCAERRAFLVVDAPASWRGSDATEVSAYRSEHRANAALYLPRIRLGRRLVPTSGAVAGLCAREDPWKAPAGRGAVLHVEGLSTKLGSAEVEALAAAGANCLRTVRGDVVVCGARTLAGSATEASEWRYVNVRRLLLFLEESIDEGLSWAAFEPNDELLWRKVRTAVEGFLVQAWRAGALVGEKLEEACFVRCDRTTMTQDDIDAGRLILLVGFAAVRPAEFVVFRICTKTA